MRKLVFVFCIVALLALAQPAEAQLRTQAQAQNEQAPVRLYSPSGSSLSLSDLFDPNDFKMQHSYELSAGTSHSYGLYTNTLMWQPNQKLAARVDVGYLHSPFGGTPGMEAGLENGQVFLRNAQVAYRPSEHMQVNLSIRQSPYGSYMQPYGYSPFGGAYGGRAGFDVMHHSPFWKDGR